jgi:hypothetical protein
MLGNGEGGFAAQPPADVDSDPVFAALGDLNRDGHLDVVTANDNSRSVSVLLGNGDGTVQPQMSFAVGGNQPTAVAIGDMNGDGILDLLIVSRSGNTVLVMLGIGNGSFSPPTSVDVRPIAPVSVTAAEMNGDGILDAVIGHGLSSNSAIAVLRGRP